jgi:putative DNA primase/helicase
MNTFLEVDYADKDKVKALGAKWCQFKKKWYVQGERKLQKVLDYTIMDLCVPYELKDEAKAAGAKWDVIRKTWYCSKKKSETVLKKFVEGYISDESEADDVDEA